MLNAYSDACGGENRNRNRHLRWDTKQNSEQQGMSMKMLLI